MIEATANELFGTSEPPPEQIELSAGPLTAILEDGNLRYIRFAGVEIVRAINYLARDPAWGTYRPDLTKPVISRSADRFTIAYDGSCGPAEGRLVYHVEIEGDASGKLTFRAAAQAVGDFATNRTGFVVLHPAGVAGAPLSLTHTDGRVERTTFPHLIMADQPAFDLASLEHEAAPGILCRIDMSGDAFEMEDQRNWTDASFKTYVRPLSKPRPYVMAAGSIDRQQIVVTVKGEGRAQARPAEDSALRIGEAIGRMPEVPMFVDETVPADFVIPSGVVRAMIVRLDPTQPLETFVSAVSRTARAGCDLIVELALEARDAAAEAASAMALLAKAGAKPSALMVSPRREFKTRPSGNLPDGEASTDALVDALKRAGFSGSVGAGTPSNFTEFNRNPPGAECDFVYFAVTANVHAADDRSVVETLETFPIVIESARKLRPGKPIWLGPSTIGARHNPYGASGAANPDGRRVASAQFDPRHGALFGAAFAVGVAAAAADPSVEALTLCAPAGPFGVGGRPIAQVQSALAMAAGARRHRLDLPAGLHGVAWKDNTNLSALVSNLSTDSVLCKLDSHCCVRGLVGAEWQEEAVQDGRLIVAPYRTFLISLSG